MRTLIDGRLDQLQGRGDTARMTEIYHDLALGSNAAATLDGLCETHMYVPVIKPEVMFAILDEKGYVPDHLRPRLRYMFKRMEWDIMYEPCEAVCVSQSAFGFDRSLTIDEIRDAGQAFELKGSTASTVATCLLNRPRARILVAMKPIEDRILAIDAQFPRPGETGEPRYSLDAVLVTRGGSYVEHPYHFDGINMAWLFQRPRQ